MVGYGRVAPQPLGLYSLINDLVNNLINELINDLINVLTTGPS